MRLYLTNITRVNKQHQGSIEASLVNIPSAIKKVAIYGTFSWMITWFLSMRSLIAHSINIVNKTLKYVTIDKVDVDKFKATKIDANSLKRALETSGNRFLEHIAKYDMAELMVTSSVLAGGVAAAGKLLLPKSGIKTAIVMGATGFAINGIIRAAASYLGGKLGTSYAVFKSGKGIYSREDCFHLLSIFEESSKFIDATVADIDSINEFKLIAILDKFNVKVKDGNFEMGPHIKKYVSNLGLSLGEVGWDPDYAFRLFEAIQRNRDIIERYAKYVQYLNKIKNDLTMREIKVSETCVKSFKILLTMQWFVIQGLCKTSSFLCMAVAHSKR